MEKAIKSFTDFNQEEKAKAMEEAKRNLAKGVKYWWVVRSVLKRDFENHYSQLPGYIGLGPLMTIGSDGQPKIKGMKIAFKAVLKEEQELPDMCRLADNEELEFIKRVEKSDDLFGN